LSFVDLQKSQSGLLHLAANSDYVGSLASLALVKELVSREANLDILNADGFRPLHLACGLRNDNRGNEQVNADFLFAFVLPLRDRFTLATNSNSLAIHFPGCDDVDRGRF